MLDKQRTSAYIEKVKNKQLMSPQADKSGEEMGRGRMVQEAKMTNSGESAVVRRKVVFEVEREPDFSWLEQWNTPDTYRGNEVIRDGRKLSFADYMRTVGNPDYHEMLCMVVYELAEDADDWEVVDSLGNIDFIADGDDYGTGTFYRVSAIPAAWAYLRELATEAGLPAGGWVPASGKSVLSAIEDARTF